MKYIFDLSKEDEPEPLNRQFERKKSKADAIRHHLQRKETATALFPDGIEIVLPNLIVLILVFILIGIK